MSVLKEFRDFAVKGNVVDLDVGVIIGAAFGKIVSSLVEDIVMPGIGALVGGFDFKALALQVGSAKIAYGKFLQTCFDFFVIAASIFVAVRVINHLRAKQGEKPPAATPPRQEQLLAEIRDLLKEGK